MNLSEHLWDKNRDLAFASLNSKFVQGIKNGNLPKNNFQSYIAQDYFFLESFARAYGLAISKCSDINSIRILSELLLGVSEELILHEKYAQEWEICITNNKIEKDTKSYTDFLRKISLESSCIEILVAMTPCMRLYAWIGKNLSSSISDNLYKNWILTYSDDNFEKLAKSLEEIIDNYKDSYDFDKLNYLYQNAMKLELKFFESYSDFK